MESNQFKHWNEQTVQVFAGGGPVMSSQKVEPTSGNEVPPGSSPEEVKDGVDAKLSVGEYVVPADVVQYFGVAYFEKLRNKAKEGLAELETDGQINGGEEESEDFPFKEEELSTEDDGSTPQGFAEGGPVQTTPQNPLAATGSQTKIYVGPNGQEMSILFINGIPVQQIPPGFVLKGSTPPKEEVVPKEPSDGRDNGDLENTMKNKTPQEMTIEDFEKFANPSNLSKIVTTAASALSPAIGGLISLAHNQTAKSYLEEVNARLAQEGLDEESRARLEQVKTGLEAAGNEDGQFKGLLGGVLGEGGLLGKLFGVNKQPKTAVSSKPAVTPKSSGGSGERGSDRTQSYSAPDRSPTPPSKPDNIGGMSSVGSRSGSLENTNSSASRNTNTSSPSQSGSSSSSSGGSSARSSNSDRDKNTNMAKGGFIKKRK